MRLCRTRSTTTTSTASSTTLSDVLFLGLKNDVSFLIDEELFLWEHQSTHNPNMPLRGLLYFARLYNTQVDKARLNKYRTTTVELPTPYYFVFYNGTAQRPDREVLRLSDAFSKGAEADGLSPALEVTATVLNINDGHNQELMAACQVLSDYAHLVGLIREYNKTMFIEEAIDAAIQQCIDENVLADYLTRRRAEVQDSFLTGYNEADRIQAEQLDREIARKKARVEGRTEGLAEGRAESRADDARLYKLLRDAGRLDEYLPALEDPTLMTRLFEELA